MTNQDLRKEFETEISNLIDVRKKLSDLNKGKKNTNTFIFSIVRCIDILGKRISAIEDNQPIKKVKIHGL